MSNNFKSIIRERYKGRGNCWVKVPNSSEVYDKMINIIPASERIESFIRHVEREEFGWIRFIKPSGTDDAQFCLFEVRYRGSKLDHPDCVLKIENEIAKTLPLLGNTPVKLQLEVDPLDRKEKKEKALSRKSKALSRKSSKQNSESSSEDFDSKRNIEIISEKALTNASSIELRKWEEFLSAEDLLDFAIEY